MAENKKSFVLYCDLIHTVKKMPKEKQAELFLTILEYVNDNDPEVEDMLVDLVFEPIKQQLKRDLKKYENICDRNKTNGSKGGRPKKPKKPNGLTGNPKKPKKADNDNDNDNDNGIESDNVKDIIINNKIWLESLLMKRRIDINKGNLYLGTFLDYQSDLVGEGNGLNRDIEDIQNHFVKWLDIEIKKEKTIKTKAKYVI